ncbi:MAG: hypothetical protein JKX99_07815 [Robiginitomaculum sp.]|nr:hypothetical protein [Robiginitomaculum sp.]
MANQKKTWTQKLQTSKGPVVKPAPMNIAGMKAGQIMLIPSAQVVDAFVRKIPRGKSVSVLELRQQLATDHKAEVCCPMSTGFLIRIVAEAAYEAYEAGQKITDITPIWRVLDKDAPTIKKLSFDPDFLLNLRTQEGL